MKKASKKTSAPKKIHKPLLVAVGLLVLPLALIGGTYVVTTAEQYKQAKSMAEIEPVREMILKAAEGLKVDAPVDARTGDIYFPQARLYVPALDEPRNLRYTWENDTRILSVTDERVFGAAGAKLYNAKTVEEVFAGIPELQACSRGVAVSRTEMNDYESLKLDRTAQIGNGDTAYIYIEKECSGLADTAEILSAIRAY